MIDFKTKVRFQAVRRMKNRLAALTVFFKSMAIVIGPTPYKIEKPI